MDAVEKHELLSELSDIQKDIDLGYSHRLALIIKGRSEGVSNREIGWSLGLTEAAVRAIIRRSHVEETVSHPNWHHLSSGARDLFVVLFTSGHVNMAGVIDFTPNRRAGYGGSNQTRLESQLEELDAAGLIVNDPEVDEVFIPSAVQYTIKAIDDYATVYAASPKILIAFGETLERKRVEQPDLPIWKNRVVQQKIEAAKKWKARA